MSKREESPQQVVDPNVKFKSHSRDQGLLFPPHLGDLIPDEHPVRLVNALIDEMDVTDLLKTYKSGGSSSYPPKEMLKLLVYGCVDRSYSVRVLEQQCKENICYMWLMGGLQPDHGTIHHFRKHKLGTNVKVYFRQLLKRVFTAGYVRLTTQIVDGTIIESAANRYTYVWLKNIERYKGNLEQKIDLMISEVLQQIQEADATDSDPVKDAQSEKENGSEDSKVPLSSQEVLAFIETQSQSEDPAVKKSLSKLAKKLVPKLQEYEKHLEILDGRNSYSKTDPDATFMRMKEDFGKGEATPKPAYNLMFSTENQFITNYTLHQNSNDGRNYISHTTDTLEMLREADLPRFTRAHGDAGFGKQENCEFLETQDIENFLKYQGYYKKKRRKSIVNPFEAGQFYYNEENDYHVCPMGQKMAAFSVTERTNHVGFTQTYTNYHAINCKGCPLKGLCHKSLPGKRVRTLNGNRVVSRNKAWKKHQRIAKENLESLIGIRLRSQRSIDVESVFGHIKYNRRFNRATMWGLPGIETMMGLLSMANNIKKLAKLRQTHGRPTPSPQNLGQNQAIKANKTAKSNFRPLTAHLKHHICNLPPIAMVKNAA